MSYTAESQTAGRHILPDLVRAFAVLGIALVNVAYFAWPSDAVYLDGGLQTPLDHAANFGVNAVFLLKAYTLFSFMFGVGMAYQIRSAARRDVPFGRRYSRRLIGLLLLGILHVTFAFAGDILIIYAFLGAVLYLFRNKPVKSLIRWGAVLLVVQVLIAFIAAGSLYAWEAYDPQDMLATADMTREGFDSVYATFRDGRFRDVALFRWREWAVYFFLGLIGQGPTVLGFFLFGLAAVKSEIISNPTAPIWAKARSVAFPIGVLISVAGAYIIATVDGLITTREISGLALISLGSPFATFGYLGWLAKWAAGPETAFKTFIARGGTATLTAYLLQSLILSFIFSGYGFGLYGEIGAAGCIAIALATGIFTLVFVSLWRIKFRQGPFEYALRRFTYWGDNR